MTARTRLALLYGLLFLTMGIALSALSYQLVSHNLPAQRVEAASGRDVVLRAAKLAGFSELSDSDRTILARIASGSPDDALAAAEADRSALSPSTYEGLTSGLAVNVRSDALHQLLIQSLIALALVGIASAALGWLLAGRVLRPLAVMADTAKRLSSTNLEERINLSGPDDELTRLAAAFDDMLDRLAAAFEGQRRFVANASHELRTPLTIIATELDVTMARPDATSEDFRRMSATVRETVDRSDRLITSLLALALVEEDLETATKTDLAAIVRDSLAVHVASIAQANLSVSAQLNEAVVIGDPGLLDRLAGNLIENAINHNNVNGWITLRTVPVGAEAIFEIENSGAIIADDSVESLFEPFRRLAATQRSRHSIGLGLSIVRAITRAHGGSIHVEARHEGGLRVAVRLPATRET